MSVGNPIASAPQDGTPILLYFGGEYEGWIEGWWFSSPKQIDDGWETIIGSIGEPTHWLEHPGRPSALAQPT